MNHKISGISQRIFGNKKKRFEAMLPTSVQFTQLAYDWRRNFFKKNKYPSLDDFTIWQKMF